MARNVSPLRRMSTERQGTAYRRETACRGCEREFTATVEAVRVPPSNGDYLRTTKYSVPSFCPACAAERAGVPIVRSVTPSDGVSLTWRGRLKQLMGRLNYEESPSQPEQIDLLLDILPRLEDPIEGGVDWVMFEDADALPFYYARRRLDDEQYDELSERASEDFDIDIDDLVRRGKRHADEEDITPPSDIYKESVQ